MGINHVSQYPREEVDYDWYRNVDRDQKDDSPLHIYRTPVLFCDWLPADINSVLPLAALSTAMNQTHGELYCGLPDCVNGAARQVGSKLKR